MNNFDFWNAFCKTILKQLFTMKKISIILLSLVFPFLVMSQDSNNWKIKKGEKLKYKVAFNSGLTGDIKGGEATMSVMSKTVQLGDNEVYHATLAGGTTGIIEWFYQVENKYESYIDVKTGEPLLYAQSVRENKYRNKDTVFFDPKNHTAIYKEKKIKIPENTQDFLSVFYYLRMKDMSKLKAGDTFTISFFSSDKAADFKIIYNGIEKIKTKKMGQVECYSFKPQLPTGKVFKDQYPATMWISADSRRLPVLVDAKMKVGKMKMELISY
ncbi:conserved hypothetical protein [uncultured Paludibacter sp.]|uniref:DUF3108 domain-containing protein n=1 Tax=uncultured Paludibacter sp. TaxID=497635 RepID=A0A653ACM9_9BACT|nr:conserved hypothetical protein [uncultured Paludibacter sp.]